MKIQIAKGRWYVYLLRCADGSLYCGVSNDLEARVLCHNAGDGAKYTRSRLPVALVYAERKRGQSSALRREYQIKQLSRADKERLFEAKSQRRIECPSSLKNPRASKPRETNRS